MTDPAREAADKARDEWAAQVDADRAESDRRNAEWLKSHPRPREIPMTEVLADMDRDERKTFAVTAMIALAALSLFVFVIANGCSVRTSDGDRFGVITKLSRRGLVRDSWEGEAIIGSIEVPGVGTVWSFTVDDDGPINSVRSAMESGKKVHIHYIEYLHRGILNGDTDRRVTGIEGVSK